MSLTLARHYYDVIDRTETSPTDIAELYSESATLKSPREGAFTGRNGIETFYHLNEQFFAEGAHNMTNFYDQGHTVICEGTVDGKTTAGRSYEGVGLVDVMEFNRDEQITTHRIYLDYSAIYSQLPDEVPSFK